MSKHKMIKRDFLSKKSSIYCNIKSKRCIKLSPLVKRLLLLKLSGQL